MTGRGIGKVSSGAVRKGVRAISNKGASLFFNVTDGIVKTPYRRRLKAEYQQGRGALESGRL